MIKHYINSQKIKEFLKENKLCIRDLTKLTPLSEATIYKIVNKKEDFPLTTIFLLARGLGVSISSLIDKKTGS